MECPVWPFRFAKLFGVLRRIYVRLTWVSIMSPYEMLGGPQLSQWSEIWSVRVRRWMWSRFWLLTTGNLDDYKKSSPTSTFQNGICCFEAVSARYVWWPLLQVSYIGKFELSSAFQKVVFSFHGECSGGNVSKVVKPPAWEGFGNLQYGARCVDFSSILL